MTHRYIKIALTVLVLGGAFSGMLWSTLRDGTEYFKTVDEAIADPQALSGKRVQLHGYVVPGTWVQRPNSLDYKFKVQNNPARGATPGGVVEASYTGLLPDTFKDEDEGGGANLDISMCHKDFRESVPNRIARYCNSRNNANTV